MKKSTRSAARKSSRVSRPYSAALETLEPRTLLTASVISRVDLTGYGTPVAANLDGQPGFELVAIKDNVVKIINESTNTVSTFTFSLGSTITVVNPQTIPDTNNATSSDDLRFTEKLDNARTSEIYATNGRFFTTLNVNTGVMNTYNIGSYAKIAAVNLDGQPGLEYVFYTLGSNSITVVNPRLNTLFLATFPNGPYDNINFAPLDGQTGMDIYFTSGNELGILNPNTQVFHSFNFPRTVDLEPVSIPLPTFEQLNSQDVVTFIDPGDYTITNQFGSSPFTLTSGNTPLFAPIALAGHTNNDLVAVINNSVWVIDDTANTMRLFTLPQNSTVHLSFAPHLFDSDNLTIGGTDALIFGSTGSSITALNTNSGLMKTFNIPSVGLLLTTDIGGGLGSQIISANGSSVTVLNPSGGIFKTYKTPAYSSLGLDNLDGVTGDEIYLAGNGTLTIISPLRQTFRTFNVGAFDAVIPADLDGQPGDELYTIFTHGDGSTITVLNFRLGTFRTYNIGVYFGTGHADLDGVAGDEIFAGQPGGATILNPRLGTFKTYHFDTTTASAPITAVVGSLPGHQVVITTANSVIVINAAAGVMKTYAIDGAAIVTIISLGPPNHVELLSMAGFTFTFRNLATGTASNLNVGVALIPLLINNQIVFDDLDGQPGDEIFFMDGQVLKVIKAS